MIRKYRLTTFVLILLFFLSGGTALAAITSTYTPPCTDKSPSCRDQRLGAIETELSDLDRRISALEGTPVIEPSPTPTPTPTKTTQTDSRQGGVIYYGSSVQGPPEGKHHKKPGLDNS